MIEHCPSRLVVTSPGELVFGVTEDNILILMHVSKPRNRCVAQALHVLPLAERAGSGVDVMVRSMIRTGHQPPVIRSREGHVRALLNGGAPVARTANVMASLPAELREDTGTALVIHHLRSHATVDAVTLAPVLQKTPEEAADVLRRLSDDALDLIEPTREHRRSRHPRYRFRSGSGRSWGPSCRTVERLRTRSTAVSSPTWPSTTPSPTRPSRTSSRSPSSGRARSSARWPSGA